MFFSATATLPAKNNAPAPIKLKTILGRFPKTGSISNDNSNNSPIP